MDRSILSTKLSALTDNELTVPGDVVATVLFVVFTDALLIRASVDVPAVRAAVALPAVLLVPGYVLVAVLYPRRYRGDRPSGRRSVTARSNASNAESRRTRSVRPIHWKERLALSFGGSLAVVPLLAMVVALAAGSLSLRPVLIGLNAFILVGAVAALVRRNRVPPGERYRPSLRRVHRVARNAVSVGNSRVDRLLTVLLLFSAVTAGVALGAAVLAPQDGETFTSATLLAESDDGNLVASGYPNALNGSDPGRLTLRVENHEGERTTYAVVAELQRVRTGNGSVTVEESETVFRERQTVRAGGTWRAEHAVEPAMSGEDLRLSYYLYRGEAPETPARSNAYRYLYLWVNAPDSGG